MEKIKNTLQTSEELRSIVSTKPKVNRDPELPKLLQIRTHANSTLVSSGKDQSSSLVSGGEDVYFLCQIGKPGNSKIYLRKLSTLETGEFDAKLEKESLCFDKCKG